MRRSLPWIAGAALVVAAGTVTALTPAPDALRGAFLIRGGETVTSRTLVAELQDAVLADRVSTEDGAWAADGNWLVVTVVVSAPETEADATLELAKLVIDGREFLASERPSTSLVRTDLRVGIDTTGMLAFELPDGLDAGDADLRLSLPYATPRLDDVIVLPLSLEGLPRESTVEILEPTLAGTS
ncbi:hypothetical protein [Microbacterium tumbae]